MIKPGKEKPAICNGKTPESMTKAVGYIYKVGTDGFSRRTADLDLNRLLKPSEHEQII
jgi:hypothetical protein